MGIFDEADVISTYTLTQAIADGMFVEIFKHRWPELSGGTNRANTSFTLTRS